MLQVGNLGKSYGGRVLFEGMNFTINPGERVALVGRNGHGKSTLLKIIMGLEEYDEGSITKGSGYQIGYLAQHISFTECSVLAEVLSVLPKERQKDAYLGERLLAGLGFSESDFALPPEGFSGGYQLRIELAKVLINQPNLLLLDEPTNYLDIVSVRWLEKELVRWRGEILIISHDRGVLSTVCTHTLAIHRCKTKKVKGDVEKVRAVILEEELQYEKNREQVLKRKEELEAFITRFRAQASKAALVQSRVKELEKLKGDEALSQIVDLSFKFREAGGEHKQLLAGEDVTFSYNNTQSKILSQFNFTIKRGDRIGVIGKNGRGKSTLLRLIAKQLVPNSGEIRYHDATIAGYFGQTNLSTLNDEVTIEDEIFRVNNTLSRTEVRKICGIMMFPQDDGVKKIKLLSGGEKSRVLIGQLLAKRLNLLLLDEPTSHLDMESVDALIEAMDSFSGSVVLVSHDESVLRRVCNRLIVFQNNEILIYEGSYDQFLEDVGWEDDVSSRANTTAAVLDPNKILKRKKALESELSRLENEQKQIEVEIEACSASGDYDHIMLLTERLGDVHEEQERVLEELVLISD